MLNKFVAIFMTGKIISFLFRKKVFHIAIWLCNLTFLLFSVGLGIFLGVSADEIRAPAWFSLIVMAICPISLSIWLWKKRLPSVGRLDFENGAPQRYEINCESFRKTRKPFNLVFDFKNMIILLNEVEIPLTKNTEIRFNRDDVKGWNTIPDISHSTSTAWVNGQPVTVNTTNHTYSGRGYWATEKSRWYTLHISGVSNYSLDSNGENMRSFGKVEKFFLDFELDEIRKRIAELK